MTSILQRILGAATAPSTSSPGDTETVRRIVRELESMEPERARMIAAFAFVLARVANADQDISVAETEGMEMVVQAYGGLPEEQAILVVQIAKAQQRLAGGTENFLVTRELNEISDDDEKERILHSLFAVSAADNEVSFAEENVIRQIATELGLTHRQFSEVRSRFNDKRTILRNLPRPEQSSA